MYLLAVSEGLHLLTALKNLHLLVILKTLHLLTIIKVLPLLAGLKGLPDTHWSDAWSSSCSLSSRSCTCPCSPSSRLHLLAKWSQVEPSRLAPLGSSKYEGFFDGIHGNVSLKRASVTDFKTQLLQHLQERQGKARMTKVFCIFSMWIKTTTTEYSLLIFGLGAVHYFGAVCLDFLWKHTL